MPRPGPAWLDAKKKTLSASERNEDDREAFRQLLATLPPEQLVIVDESSTHLSMTPRYARAPRGQRASARVPRNHGKNITLLAALTAEGISAAATLEGAVDSATFEIFIAEVLAPTLRSGQLVILDHLSSHKTAQIQALVEQQGCRLLYLPASSPDLSPIELAFSKLKTYVRHVGARVREGLEQAIREGLDRITPRDVQGWFRHCGYQATYQSL